MTLKGPVNVLHSDKVNGSAFIQIDEIGQLLEDEEERKKKEKKKRRRRRRTRRNKKKK